MNVTTVQKIVLVILTFGMCACLSIAGAYAYTHRGQTQTADQVVSGIEQTLVAIQVQQTVIALGGSNGSDTTGQEPAANNELTATPTATSTSESNVVVEPPDPGTTIDTTPRLRVTSSSVNVRSGPGTNYPSIGTLSQDQIVKVISKNGDGSWFKIEMPNGSTGWIAASVTEPVVVADMAQVPVEANIPPPPATPTSTPTATATATATPSTTPTASPTTVTLVTITVVNEFEQVRACHLFIKPSSNSDWGSDLLTNSNLDPGSQASFQFNTGTYDFKASDCSGHPVTDLFNQSVGSSGFTWEMKVSSNPGTATINTIVGREALCGIYVRTPSATTWGTNRIEGQRFEVGQTFTIQIQEGEYNLKVEGCSPSTHVNVPGYRYYKNTITWTDS